MGKKINKEKLEIFKFLRKYQLYRKSIAYDKIMPNQQILQKYAY